MIRTWQSPWPNYGISWCNQAGRRYTLAVGSFVEDYANKVSIVRFDDTKNEFDRIAEFDHPYPPSKVVWSHEKDERGSLLATTGNLLRIWDTSSPGIARPKVRLSNAQMSDFCAPITSMDWNEANPALIVTSSIDTTCTVWDIETQQVKCQLVAHDKEVFDAAFAKGVDIFATAGGDSSIRLFDLRGLDHSTIIYESADFRPFVRLAWNKADPNYLATFSANSSKLVLLDVRVPSVPVMELLSHTSSINSLAWAPHSACHLCSVGDDAQALVWDISSSKRIVDAPILCYKAPAEINQVVWPASQTEWVAIGFQDRVQILHV
jgi:WD repeat-containing protein 68